MKNSIPFAVIAFTILSCKPSSKSLILPNSTAEIDKIDNYNTQYNASFTTSQMYCLYQNSNAYFIDKLDNSAIYEYFYFIEDEEKYQKLLTCTTLKTPLPSVDFSQELLVIGFNNKCRNIDGIKQYLIFDEDNILTINVVTKGQRGGGMGIGFVSKIKKKDKKNIKISFLYNYTN